MLQVPALLDGRSAKLELYSSTFRVVVDGKGEMFPYRNIIGVHIKNETLYLLKLRLATTAVILQFTGMGVRDLAKALILHAMAPYEKTGQDILEANLDARAIHSSVRKSNLPALVETSARDWTTSPSLYAQKPCADIYSKDFLAVITQPLIDAFVTMNCTLHQFYNIFTSTYFYDTKNSKVPLDRILANNIRGNTGDAAGPSLDYATRINSHSMMVLGNATLLDVAGKEARRKQVEFPPAVPFPIQKEQPVAQPVGGARPPFVVSSLPGDFSPELQSGLPFIKLDPKDFELARDICRIVWQQPSEAVYADAQEFTKGFREMLLGQYGPDTLRYVEWLLPTFYIKKESK